MAIGCCLPAPGRCCCHPDPSTPSLVAPMPPCHNPLELEQFIEYQGQQDTDASSAIEWNSIAVRTLCPSHALDCPDQDRTPYRDYASITDISRISCKHTAPNQSHLPPWRLLVPWTWIQTNPVDHTHACPAMCSIRPPVAALIAIQQSRIGETRAGTGSYLCPL